MGQNGGVKPSIVGRPGSAQRRRLIAFSSSLILLVVGLVAAWSFLPVLPADQPDEAPSTVVFRDRETPLGLLRDDGVTGVVTVAELNETVGAALMAMVSESRKHHSMSLATIAVETVDAIRGQPVTLGSPITRTFVDQLIGDADTRIGRLRSLATMAKAERTLDDASILSGFLTTADFGRGAHGIGEAAQAYFGKSVRDLDLAEAALLIAVQRSPLALDPNLHPDEAQAAWRETYGELVNLDESVTATRSMPATLPYRRIDGLWGPNGYLVEMAKTELVAAGFSADDLNRAGLTIVTTLDAAMQGAAVDAIARLPLDRPPGNRVALVSVDPSSGAIRALYGGEDYERSHRNFATEDRAQGGSTFKPFALIAALEAGWELTDTYSGESPVEVDSYLVRNVDEISRGVIDLKTATVNSVNTVFAQLNSDVGPEVTLEVAIRAGLPEDTPGLEAVPSNVFGSASPRPMDMATVFSTYAAGGVRHDLFVVAEVRDDDGSVIYTGGGPDKRVFDPSVIADTTAAMTGVIQEGTGRAANLPGRPAAGKTGSSQDYKSAWFCGFVPQLATVVAMYQVGDNGAEEPLTPFGGVEPIMGGSYPAAIWQRYMLAATSGMEVLPFPSIADEQEGK